MTTSLDPGPKLLRWTLAVYILFVIYGSLVPMHLSPRSVLGAMQEFARLPAPSFAVGDRSDWAVNFLLLVPIAFGVRHCYGAHRNKSVAMLRTVLIAVTLLVFSTAIEFAQMFFPPRNPSLNDVMAQFAGSVVGLGLQAHFGTAFARWLHKYGTSAPQPTRLQTLLGTYLFMLLAFSVMPLDLSISPVELYRKWRAGRVILIPFGEPLGDLGLWLYNQLVDILIWVPVGLWWTIDGRMRLTRAVLTRVLIASAVIELAQLFVLSRVTDVTDVLLAVTGAWVGVQAAQLGRQWSSYDAAGLRRVAWLLWWFWLVIVMLVFWFPFDFSWARMSTATLSEALTRMPFQSYFYRSEFGALNEIVRKLAFFLPGGLLLGFAVRARAWPHAFLLILACVIETGQLMLPERLADLTDAALESLGGLMGLRLGAWLASASTAGGLADPADEELRRKVAG